MLDVGATLVVALGAGTSPCPKGGGIINDHNGVKMVGHNHKCTQFDLGKPFGHGFPNGMDHPASIIENHFTITNCPEKRHSAL